MFFRRKIKSFYTCDEIKEMLVAYHEKGDKSIKKLNKDLKFFAHHYDYHFLTLIQEYDIVSKDESANKIIFRDSQTTDEKVYVYVEIEYFSKDDIAVTYNDRKCLYQAEVYRFGYEPRESGDGEWFYMGYKNEYDDWCFGSGVDGVFYRPKREEGWRNDICGFPNFTTHELMEIPMYSDNVLLIKTYQNYDLTCFNSQVLNNFKANKNYLETSYQDIKISIELDLKENNVNKRISKVEDILKNETHLIWLKDQIKVVHKLYKEWYDEDNHGKFIDNLDEYANQYYLESLYIDNKGNVSAYYMDKIDSFLGHGISIDVGSRGKIQKFSL